MISMKYLPIVIFLIASISVCGQGGKDILDNNKDVSEMNNLEIATIGGGCFWCIEAVFQELKGVEKVESGYAQGDVKNPSYKEVGTGSTGHNEVVRVYFNPKIVSFVEVLEVFFTVHDPTTLNRQGNDVGTQYRSGIYFHNAEQEKTANEIIDKLNQSGAYNSLIVTEVEEVGDFYIAEQYHQDYYSLNSSQPYCAMVVKPKVDKFKKVFADRVKETAK